MKNNYLLLLLIAPMLSLAQVGIGNTNPQGALDISTDSATNPTNADGLLIPRVALSDTTTATVITPTQSEVVYNTATAGDVTPGFYSWDGAKWIRFTTNDDRDKWSLTGNTAINPATNFIGTFDSQPLSFRTGNTEKFKIRNNTYGTASFGMTWVNGVQNSIDPYAALEVNGNSDSTGDVAIHSVSNSGFGSWIVGSKARGTFAAPTVISGGNQLLNIIGMGYDGTTYRVGANIVFNAEGTPAANSMPSSISFATSAIGQGPTINTGSTTERMRITSTGNVGIGTSTPNYKLDVTGNLRATTNSYFATASGNVAIGTTTPYGLAKLEVNAASSLFRIFDFPLVTNSMVLAAEFTGKNNSGALVRFAGPTTRYMDLGQDATGNFTIRRNDLNAFLIDTYTGNIGIGTPTPSAKLDVLGTIKITDGTQGLGKILTSDANGTASWSSYVPPLLRTYEGTSAEVNPINAAISGSIIYTQNSGNPFFPEDLPDGFTCTIVNYSNFVLSSNTLTSAVFITPTSGYAGATSFSIPSGGSVNVYVVTIAGQRKYYIK